MSSMHETPPEPTDPLDVETFAQPAQQRRFVAAMAKIAASRAGGTSVRVFVSAGPRTMNGSKWDSWLAQITEELPAGVEVLHYRNVFSAGRSYDWEGFADSLDGLVIVGKQKRPGSRVYLLGPVARLELRSMIAQKPVLLYAHNLGLIPVIDCQNQVLSPSHAPRLKLIAPKRWRRDTSTIKAALGALAPAGAKPADQGDRGPLPGHLLQPFAAPSK